MVINYPSMYYLLSFSHFTKNMNLINNFVAYGTIFHLFLWTQFIINVFSRCIWDKYELSKTGISSELENIKLDTGDIFYFDINRQSSVTSVANGLSSTENTGCHICHIASLYLVQTALGIIMLVNGHQSSVICPCIPLSYSHFHNKLL